MMGKLTGLCVLLSVLNVAVTEDTVTPVYFTDGGDLTLIVRPPLPDHIYFIVWLFNDNLLAEWVEGKGFYLRIKGRATLTTETGQLIINNMRKEDEGVYSVEINDRVQTERYKAKLIKKVQKPKVVVRTVTFVDEHKSCRLTCDSDTTGAEPITYSWKKGDGEWEVLGKDIFITSIDDSGVKTITCRMENPVSREESDPESNLLYINVGMWVGIFFGVLMAVAVVGWVAWIKKIGPFKRQETNITDSANGNGQPTSPPSDSSPNPAETVPLQDNPKDTKSDAKETA